MRRKFAIGIQLGTLAVSGLLACSLAAAQAPKPPTLDEQLKAQYQVAETRWDSGIVTIVKPGTVLAVQKGGILGFLPEEKAVWCPTTYKDGNLKGPSAFCRAMVAGKNTHLFQIGEKVYPTKIDVKKEKISIFLIDCDSSNGVNSPSFYKSEVIFQFPEGYLETASASQVEDTIGQVLTIDESGGQGQQQAADQPQAPPQAIQLGQTLDQVVGVLGQPQQIVNLGAKQIYVYKQLKVTLLNGKVSDVE